MTYDLKNMSYEELLKLGQKVDIARQAKYPEHKLKRERDYLKGVEQRKKAQEKFIKDILPKLNTFSKTLIVGDIVSFKGTRGSAVRRVVEVKGDHILGLVLRSTHNGWQPTGYSSENQVANLQSIYRDGAWKQLKDIL